MLTTAERHGTVDDVLGDLGYGAALREQNFPTWTGSELLHPDIVAFGRTQPRDMTTATVTCLLANGDHGFDAGVRAARALATPAMLIAGPEQVSLFAIGRSDVERVHHQDYGQRRLSSDRLRAELAPEALLAAKRASRQLALFPTDVALLTQARQRSGEQLSARVEGALRLARRLLPKDISPPERYRLVVGAIAALMVRDKLAFGHLTGPALIDAAQVRFPGYFGWLSDVTQGELDALDALIADLEQGLDYRGLDPAIVSDVYERAVIDRTTRKEFGIFYTPPELARRIAAALPFEEVPPAQRVVVDPACGSGTLLLAVQDRLLAAAPSAFEFDEAHRYLTRHLFGFDRDAFAVEIARLSLLLNALPIGNDWHVEQHDARGGFPGGIPQPRFVISNPPWDLEWDSEGRRRQLADHFVGFALNGVCDGGHVALVLPASFLESRASRRSRQEALKQAAVNEVWRLPDNAFRLSRVDAVVVMLQKRTSQGSYLFRRSLPRPGWQERLFEEGRADWQRLVAHDDVAPDALAFQGPLDAVPHLRHLPSLRAIATIQTGPVPTPGFDDRLRRRGEFLWLRKAGSMPLFADVSHERLEKTSYPTGFNWRQPGSGWIYRRPKVLVSAVRTTANPWRLRVGIDSVGVIPRQSLHLVIPNSDSPATLPALAALLASSVAACWTDTHSASRSIRLAVLASLPVPAAADAWRTLDAVGQRCLRAAERGTVSAELLAQLEDTVAAAYDLGDARDAVADFLAGFPGPEDRVRFPLPQLPGGEPLNGQERYFGAVLEVDDQRLRLWVPGLTPPDGEWIPLPDRLFASLCHEGASFEVRVANGALREGEFRLQPHSYQEVHELAADLLPQT